MHIWMIDIHPLTAPIANELTFAVTQLCRMLGNVYSGALMPAVHDVALIIKLVN